MARRRLALLAGVLALLMASQVQGAQSPLELKDGEEEVLRSYGEAMCMWPSTTDFRRIKKLPNVPLDEYFKAIIGEESAPKEAMILFKDTGKGGAWRFIVDIDLDGDLSNEAIHDVAPEGKSTPVVRKHSGQEIEYLFEWYERTGKFSKMRAWPRQWREGLVDIDGKKVRVALVIPYVPEHVNTLFVDWSGDGKFDIKTRWGLRQEVFLIDTLRSNDPKARNIRNKYLLVGDKIFGAEVKDDGTAIEIKEYKGPTGVLAFRDGEVKGVSANIRLVYGPAASDGGEIAFWLTAYTSLIVSAETSLRLPVGDWSINSGDVSLKGKGKGFVADIFAPRIPITEGETTTATLVGKPVTTVSVSQGGGRGLLIERKTVGPDWIAYGRKMALIENGKHIDPPPPIKVEVLRGDAVIDIGQIGYG